MKRVTWFVLFLITGVSCLDQPDCYRQNLNLIGIAFKKLFDGKADTVTLYKVTGDGFPFYADTINTTSIAVALNYLNKNNQMTLSIDGFLKSSTINLGYLARPQFVSAGCGERFIVTDLKVLDYTASNNDSVRVTSNLPSNPAGTNIVIYRCPRPDNMRFRFRQLNMDFDSLGKDDPRVIHTIAINSIEYKYSATATSSVVLPLDPNANSIAYTFKFDNEEANVSFDYHTSQREIIPNSKCGTQAVFGKLKTNKTDFPFMKIVKDSIYDPPITNVVSYRCPTTNQIGILFREKKGDSRPASVTITSITADFAYDFSAYANTTVSSLVLPLNPSTQATSTQFTFIINGQPKVLKIDYAVVGTLFHKNCGTQPVYTGLVIDDQSAGFSAQDILDPIVKFPSVNNVEIIP